MNKRTPIIDNPIYSAILFELADKENNSTGIARIMKKTQGIIYRQLIVLQKEKWILPCDNIKNGYSINWNKIMTEWVSFLEQKAKERIKEYRHVEKAYREHNDEEFRKAVSDLTKINKDLTEKMLKLSFQKKIIQSEFVQKLLRYLISMHTCFSKKTLNQIFNELLIYMGAMLEAEGEYQDEHDLIEVCRSILRSELIGMAVVFSQIESTLPKS